MKAILFYIFFCINWIITLLPLRILYIFSYILYFFLAYLPGYRKDIVTRNLKNSFPEKEKKELNSIRRKYYLHLADLFIEALKLQHISPRDLKKRYHIINPEILDRLNSEGRSAVAVFGHYGNWEWITIAQEYTMLKFLVVYKPLKNKYFDRYLYKIRSRFGIRVVKMSDTLREFIDNKNKGISTITALISDQTPPKSGIHYWTTFLNQDTPVYTGIEKMSNKFDLPVLYFNISKAKRGYYTINIEVLSDGSEKLPEHAITELHVRKLEEQIRECPELWIWSHRRWKHKKPALND